MACLVDGNGADGDLGVFDDGLTDSIKITPRGEVHDRVGPCLDGYGELGEFLFDVDTFRTGADVGIHLDGASFPTPFGMTPL